MLPRDVRRNEGVCSVSSVSAVVGFCRGCNRWRFCWLCWWVGCNWWGLCWWFLGSNAVFCAVSGVCGFVRECRRCGSGVSGFTRARSSCVGGASGFDAVSLVLLGVDHLNRLSARAATCMWLARHNACPQSGVFGNSLGAAVAHGTCCCLVGPLSADCDQNLGDDLVDEF